MKGKQTNHQRKWCLSHDLKSSRNTLDTKKIQEKGTINCKNSDIRNGVSAWPKSGRQGGIWVMKYKTRRIKGAGKPCDMLWMEQQKSLSFGH